MRCGIAIAIVGKRCAIQHENVATRVGVLMDVADMGRHVSDGDRRAAETIAYDGFLTETLLILVEA